MNNADQDIRNQSDLLFRHHYGKVIALLVYKYGAHQTERIEDAVSDAIYKALKTWAFHGIPQQPAAWLLKVAERNLIDVLRRKNNYEQNVIHEFSKSTASITAGNFNDNSRYDETLRLLFITCHDELKISDQLALSLKLVSGFSIKEIAMGLHKPIETIKKRIQRAKSHLAKRESQDRLTSEFLKLRKIPAIRRVLYLMFNEGYLSQSPETTIRYDICAESMRLCRKLLEVTPEQDKNTYALLALMSYHAARFPARVDDQNRMIVLQKQNRDLWDKRLLLKADQYMEHAMMSERLHDYHLEAAIAALHSKSDSFEQTPWHLLVDLYKRLVSLKDSPLIKLNLCTAYIYNTNFTEAATILDEISVDDLASYKYLFYAVKAEYFAACDKPKKQQEYLYYAIDAATSDRDRAVFRERLQEVTQS